MARIINFGYDYLEFDTGDRISHHHYQDCCECNYADYSQVDDIALGTEFDLDNLVFERAEGGFRFGNENRMFFVPCYSEQNGSYSNDLDIYFNNDLVLGDVICELDLR